MLTYLSNLFKKTPEQILTKNLSDAVDVYNDAFRACKRAGLDPYVKSGDRPVWDTLKIQSVVKITTERLL